MQKHVYQVKTQINIYVLLKNGHLKTSGKYFKQALKKFPHLRLSSNLETIW